MKLDAKICAIHAGSIRYPWICWLPPAEDYALMRQIARSSAGLLAGLMGASAVMLGAFGAHALRDVLDARGIELWHTAVQYHFGHALALAVAALLPPGASRRCALVAFAIGVVLFSGSLYALALGAPRWCGAITPLGGVAFIVGWIALGLGIRSRAGG
jgi:uncharacterized membrane protein YgdD (TMEM256/DUF423 family)